MSIPGWPEPPQVIALTTGEVHIWSLSLQMSGEAIDQLTEVLTPDESERAARYLHRPARDQYVTARAGLRMLLSRYMALPPERILLTVGNTGKPRLAGGGLHFNVSHTQGMALIAVTRSAEVGVDVERIRQTPTHRDMADRYFTPAEAAALRRLPPGASEHAFYHVWTRKEAFLKATGLGLSHGLERFEVSVPPDDPARLLHIDGCSRAASHWTMNGLEPAPGYVGALAIEVKVDKVCQWRLEMK